MITEWSRVADNPEMLSMARYFFIRGAIVGFGFCAFMGWALTELGRRYR